MNVETIKLICGVLAGACFSGCFAVPYVNQTYWLLMAACITFLTIHKLA